MLLIKILRKVTRLRKNYSILVRCGSQSSKVRVRFAPSPTGQLHLGGFRTALYNYMFAIAHEGRFILRIEDTDQSRTVPGVVDKLHDILNWTGVIPHEGPFVGGDFGPYIQSQRKEIYEKFAKILLDKGAAYPCFCSERRLELLRKEALRNREIPKYDNQCRHLTEEEIQEKQTKNIPHVLRFKMDSQIVTFTDIICGASQTNPAENEGDPVIIKSDGFPTYHFANVVDDHLMQISHVLRGVEWHCSTHKHLLIYKAFGWEPPKFAHLPLILNKSGAKLSKRQSDVYVEEYRTKGYSPKALINFVRYCGGGFGSTGKIQLKSVKDLAQVFSLESMNSASGRLDFNILDDLNRMFITESFHSTTDINNLLNDLRQLVQTSLSNKDVKLVDLNDSYLKKVLGTFYSRICRLNELVGDHFLYLWIESHDIGPLLKSEGVNSDLISSCENLLESLPSFDKSDVLPALKTFSKQNSTKFDYLMKVLRIALTGCKEGLPVAEVLEVLGKERSLKKIHNAFVTLSEIEKN